MVPSNAFLKLFPYLQMKITFEDGYSCKFGEVLDYYYSMTLWVFMTIIPDSVQMKELFDCIIRDINNHYESIKSPSELQSFYIQSLETWCKQNLPDDIYLEEEMLHPKDMVYAIKTIGETVNKSSTLVKRFMAGREVRHIEPSHLLGDMEALCTLANQDRLINFVFGFYLSAMTKFSIDQEVVEKLENNLHYFPKN